LIDLATTGDIIAPCTTTKPTFEITLVEGDKAQLQAQTLEDAQEWFGIFADIKQSVSSSGAPQAKEKEAEKAEEEKGEEEEVEPAQ
jgi:hypothetical protein